MMSANIAAMFTMFVALTIGRLDDPIQLAAIALAGLSTPLVAYYIIRTDGPQEIRDALWGCLNLDDDPQALRAAL